MTKVALLLADLEKKDAQAKASRAAILAQARRALTTEHVKVTHPAMEAVTLPPASKGPKKRSRRPPPMQAPTPTPITMQSGELETFADLLDSKE